MRRAPAWIVVVGVVVGWPVAAARAADGFWVTLAAGAAGSATPSDYSEFWFDSPHAPPIAVNSFTGSGLVQATTGGGNTFFTSEAGPILLPTTDGYATITNPGVTNGSGGLPKFSSGNLATGAPQSGQPLGDANLLSGSLGEKAGDGSQVLSVGITDKDGNPLGSGQVAVPDGGWWVIGLGPGTNGTTPPPPDPDPIGGGNGGTGGNGGGTGGNDGGTGGNPPPDPDPIGGGTGGNGGGSVATPEPATAVLLGVAGLSAAGWRRLRRQK